MPYYVHLPSTINGALAGNATAANQLTEIGLLQSIDTHEAQSYLTLVSIDNHLASIDTKFTNPLPVSITGTVPISGTINIGNFPATQPISGSVSVSNFPSNQNVTVTNASIAVTGPLTDTQLRATPVPVSLTSTTITGTVAATQSGTWTTGRTWSLLNTTDSVNVGNFPSVQTVSVNNFPAIQPVSQSGTWSVGRTWTLSNATDSVNIGNFPATQPVSGTVAVSNFPATQNVNVTNASLAVTGPLTDAQLRATAVPVILPADALGSTSNITVVDSASATATGFAGQSQVTGTPTAGSTVALTINSIQTVMVMVSGTWTGTLSVETSSDGNVTWEPRGIHVVGTSIFAANVTANVTGSMNASAKTGVRVRATTAIAGTATIRFLVSDNVSNVYVASAVNTKTPLNPSVPAAISVGVASVQVVAANSSRRGLVLTNTSNAIIYLAFGVPAVIGSGSPLYPGGSFVMDEYSFTSVAVNAIATAAASNLAIQEYTTVT